MLNIKLIELLKALNKKEMRKLGEFTSSPYFNKNENVIRLFEAVSKFYPDFDNKKLTIESLFIRVFPDEKYDYHKINNVISDLYKVTENFLVVNNYIDSDNPGDFRILHVLRQKKLYKLYKQKYNSLIDDTEHAEFRDESYWYNKYGLIAEYRKYLFDTAPNTELNTMQDEFDNFLKYSLIKLMRFYSVMIHENGQNNIPYKLRMFEEIFSFLENNGIEEPPVLSIYRNIIFLQTKKEKKYYDELKRLKDKYLSELSESDKGFLFVHLWGFIAYNVMTLADYSYYEEAFRHNEEVLRIGLRNEKNISYFDFLNYVKTACSVGKFEWAKDFIEKYKSSIPKEELDNTLNFCNGTIEQKKGNYEKALEYFAKTNYSSFILKVQVKIIQCRLFFELGMYEQAISAIDSFKHYLQREKMITEGQKESFFTFLKYLGQLLKIKEIINKKEADVELGILKNEVEQMKQNTFGVKLWLLEQISPEAGNKNKNNKIT
jgi:hypothetical protein